MQLLSIVLLATTPFGVVAQLNTLAQAAGKQYFGTATDNSELSNTGYLAQLENTQDFHQLTAVRICISEVMVPFLMFSRRRTA